MSRRTLVLSALVLALLVVLAAGWRHLSRPQPAPDIGLTTIDGRTIDLRGLQGQVVLVEFWATSCPICVREMPAIDALVRELSPEGLQMIAVAMPYDRPDHVLAFARLHRPAYQIALDPMGRALDAFGPIPGTPTRFIIGRDGRLAARLIGSIDPERLREKLRAELAPS